MPASKPTSLLKLSGGYRADRHGHRTDNADIPGELACPDHLDESARAEWDRVTAILAPLGVATPLDRAVLAAYCVNWSRWVEAEAKIAEGGLVVEGHRGVMVPNPLLRVSRDARDAMLKACGKLGLTPSDRTSLNIAAPETPDRLDELIARRNAGRGGIEQHINPELLK